MNIRYDNGLLFIDIKISYLGKSKLIKNVVIDTGASHTIISPDIVSSIGISASPLDKFITMYGIGGEHYAYRKKIDSISICGMDLKDIEIDFGVIDENGNIKTAKRQTSKNCKALRKECEKRWSIYIYLEKH